MASTISELCDKALAYLLTISVGNKGTAYSPTGSLKAGTVLKTYSFGVQVPAVNAATSTTAKINISESTTLRMRHMFLHALEKL